MRGRFLFPLGRQIYAKRASGMRACVSLASVAVAAPRRAKTILITRGNVNSAGVNKAFSARAAATFRRAYYNEMNSAAREFSVTVDAAVVRG